MKGITYLELLSTIEWRDKRLSILIRDKYECKQCKNKSYLKDSKVGVITAGCLVSQISEYINKSHFIKNFYKVSIRESYNTYVFKSDEEQPAYEASFSSFKYFKPEDLKELNVAYSDVDEINKTAKIQCVARSNPDTINWLYVTNLHVHHKYYQDGKMPWQYPSSALVTLCWACHEELHENSKVPWLDESGNLKGQLSSCGRCYGAGYISKYSHVENGVCFECYGKRFKEFC